MAGRYPPRYGGRGTGDPRYPSGNLYEINNGGPDMSDSSSDTGDQYPPNYPGGGRDSMGRNPHQNPESDSEGFSAGMHRSARHNRGRNGRDAYGGSPLTNPESDSEDFPGGMHQPSRHNRYGGGRDDMGRTPLPNAESDSEGFSDGMYGGPPGYGSPSGGRGYSSSMPTRDTFPGGSGGRTIYSPFRGRYIEVQDTDGDTSEAWSDDGPTDLPFNPRGGQGYNDPTRGTGGRARQSRQRPMGSRASEGRIRLTRSEIVDLSDRLSMPMPVIGEQAERYHLFRLQGTPYICCDIIFCLDVGLPARQARDVGLQFHSDEWN